MAGLMMMHTAVFLWENWTRSWGQDLHGGMGLYVDLYSLSCHHHILSRIQQSTLCTASLCDIFIQ